jgi:hypothetical protein
MLLSALKPVSKNQMGMAVDAGYALTQEVEDMTSSCGLRWRNEDESPIKVMR